MATILQVLSTDDCDQIHQKSMDLLAKTGVQVDSERGRQLLYEAGAVVDDDHGMVRFPREVVTACLKLAPKEFVLGGRRPGWSLPMNARQCALIADGGAIHTIDSNTHLRRPATHADWQSVTRVTDALDVFGCYWGVVDDVFGTRPVDMVTHWSDIFHNFSKHVQESAATVEEAHWFMEVLQIIFGDKDQIRRSHPVSFLLCPSSPLVLEAEHTDAYLATIGLEIPVAVMPMPLMGSTGPGTLVSNLILANCEVLAMICLVQAAQPGTPVIYAAIPAISNPYSGRFGSGEVEHSLLGAAVSEIARYYRLPVEASAGGSDQHVPGIQAGYERALNIVLPILAQPDLLVAPGLLGGSMIFSPEQFMIDLEVIRRCRRLSQGIDTGAGKWLEEAIARVGPGGNYLAQRSTRAALQEGELYLSSLGSHKPYERWAAEGMPDIQKEARQQFDQIAQTHQPLTMDGAVEKELLQLKKSAQMS